MPSKSDLKQSAGPIERGSIIGFIAGLLPGSGSTLGSFISYSTEKRLSKKPETSNNSAKGGALVPLLTLGIPGSGTTAVLIGALIMYGIRPGPQLMTEQPVLFGQ